MTREHPQLIRWPQETCYTQSKTQMHLWGLCLPEFTVVSYSAWVNLSLKFFFPSLTEAELTKLYTFKAHALKIWHTRAYAHTHGLMV